MRENIVASRLRHLLVAHLHVAANDPSAARFLTATSIETYQQLADDVPDEVTTRLTIDYDEAWEAIGLNWQTDAGFRRIGRLLGIVGRYEHEHGRPHLTVCCVSKSGSPGEGFVGLLSTLPATDTNGDPVDVWRRELLRAANWWRTACPPGSVVAGTTPRLVHDPTATFDALNDRLASRLKRLE